MKSATALLLDLVAIPSVSPMNNQPVIDYVRGCLPAKDWTIQTHDYSDAAGTPKTNLVALTKNASGSRAELTFVCHTDTVPFDENWKEAVHPVVRDGRLYGRGSCDVKSFLACVLAAVGDSDLGKLKKPIGLILTSDEEVGCIGAKFLAKRQPLTTRFMLIGEPTNLQPVRAGKGYALGTITVKGREAHSAFPTVGRSAIYDAARIIASLEELAKELQAEQNPAFDPPFTTLNVGLIEGGTAKNIVPGHCRMVVEWRPLPGQDGGYVAGKINHRLDDLRRAFPGLEAEFAVQRTDPAFTPSKTTALADLLTSVTGASASTISFGSEAAHLSGMTEETVVFGPGDMTVAHKIGEFVPVAELEQCVVHLKSAIARFCTS